MATTAPKTISPAEKKALAAFRKRAGMLRLADALRAGITRGTIERMLANGTLERLSRGLYRLADAEPLPNPDLTVVAAKVPQGVICLISALAFHELTTQIPHEVYVAIPRNAEPPRIDHPPIASFRFSGKAFSEGIENHRLGPIVAKVYSREKKGWPTVLSTAAESDSTRAWKPCVFISDRRSTTSMLCCTLPTSAA